MRHKARLSVFMSTDSFRAPLVSSEPAGSGLTGFGTCLTVRRIPIKGALPFLAWGRDYIEWRARFLSPHGTLDGGVNVGRRHERATRGPSGWVLPFVTV